jgi:competence protein ComEC
MGRLCALAVVLGAVLVQYLPELPDLKSLYAASLCLAILLVVLSWLGPNRHRKLSSVSSAVRAQDQTEAAADLHRKRDSAEGFNTGFNRGFNTGIKLFRLGLFRALVVFTALLLSITWVTWRAEQRLNAVLALEHENVVTRLTFRVTSMPNDTSDSLRFEAQVLEPFKAGVPTFLQVSWLKTPTMPEVLPGQVFRAALVLRRPHSNLNPHGFDYEGHLFAKNIRALGRLRGLPVLLADDPYASFSVSIARARHVVRLGMRRVTADMTYGAVLIALAIGDQDSVKQEHWQIFNLTGITHLVSISGSHVTMLAAVGGWLVLLIMKRARWRGRLLCERVPARVIATLAAMLVAWLYCLLAGWGVPAQRTFFMLACVAASILARHTLSASRVLAAAAAVVVVADPWAPLATGFWLSFLAVGILFAAGAAGSKTLSQSSAVPVSGVKVGVVEDTADQWHMQASRTYLFRQYAIQFKQRTVRLRQRSALCMQRVKLLCAEATRLQWLITIAMLPVLAFLFQQVSLVSPFANALAIPVLTFVVTPLALALALFGLVPGLGWLASASGVLAHLTLEYTLIPVTWLANLSWASFDVAAAPFWTLALAAVGLCWALQPPGWPMRRAGWCLLLPVLSFEPQRPAMGSWRLLAFDVGQGGAVLVQTKAHHILFDTGPRQGASDAGARTIVPGLRALGIRRLDSIVVSHADSDHAGGLFAVLKALPVRTLYSSFSFQDWLRRAPPASVSAILKKESMQLLPCERGRYWEWDGVRFEFLHPSKAQPELAKSVPVRPGKVRPSKNAQSCVLHVQGSHHSALLPGDIGVKQEGLLLERQFEEQRGFKQQVSNQSSSKQQGSKQSNLEHRIPAKPAEIQLSALFADLVVVAHHGSDTSSSQRFVQQLGAQHAIAQVGYLNRFAHPHPSIKQRWLQAKANFWQTDRHGAILARSTPGGLSVQPYSQLRQRYWHQRLP